MTPLEKVEALYEELVAWYGEGKDREVRAASKLLMIALLELKEHDRCGWQGLVEDYVHMLNEDPERFHRLIESNHGKSKRGNTDTGHLEDLIA